MPLSALVEAMEPPAPDSVRAAAADLAYRDFITVALVVPAASVPWDDNWIYIHDQGVDTMRIQNFGSWSPYLVKDGRNVLGLEYTVMEGDASWNSSDEALIATGKAELGRLGLLDPADVEAGYVVRMPKAYPYYDADYHDNVQAIRAWIESDVPNVHPVGRNGMHRYNNADHSMYTAMLTVDNLFGAHHDVWSVNVEDEYHEETVGAPSTGRDAPILPKRPGLELDEPEPPLPRWNGGRRSSGVTSPAPGPAPDGFKTKVGLVLGDQRLLEVEVGMHGCDSLSFTYVGGEDGGKGDPVATDPAVPAAPSGRGERHGTYRSDGWTWMGRGAVAGRRCLDADVCRPMSGRRSVDTDLGTGAALAVGATEIDGRPAGRPSTAGRRRACLAPRSRPRGALGLAGGFGLERPPGDRLGRSATRRRGSRGTGAAAGGER